VRSFATVPVNDWVAPPIMADGLVGVTVTEMGLSVMVTDVDLVGSLTLVAVATAVAVVTGLAAV